MWLQFAECLHSAGRLEDAEQAFKQVDQHSAGRLEDAEQAFKQVDQHSAGRLEDAEQAFKQVHEHCGNVVDVVVYRDQAIDD